MELKLKTEKVVLKYLRAGCINSVGVLQCHQFRKFVMLNVNLFSILHYFCRKSFENPFLVLVTS